MPRIPLSTAQKIGHVDAEVNQQSAPGMGFGMDDARALQNAGDAIGQAGRGLGNALMQFGERVQEAEDRLAAAEYETEWKRRQGELEKQMKENPGSVKDFGKWASDSDAAWENDSKQYTDRMSKRYRDVFEANWRRHRDDAVFRRQEITIQARVKSLQDRCAKQIQERINAGDYDGAKKLVAEFSNITDDNGNPCSPFTKDQIEGFGDFVNKSETFGELRDIFDSEKPVKIAMTLQCLQEKEKETGTYITFKNLTEEERTRWIKYGENALRKIENQQCEDALYTYLENGTYDSEDELRENAHLMSPRVFAYKMELAQKAKAAEEGRQRDAEDKIYYGHIVDYVKSGYKTFPTKEELDQLYKDGKISQPLYLKLSSFREKVDSRDKAAADAETRKKQILMAETERKKKEAEARYKEGWNLFKKNFLAELMLNGQYPATEEEQNKFLSKIMTIKDFDKLLPYQQKELLDLGKKYIEEGNPLQPEVIEFINNIIKYIEEDNSPSTKSIAIKNYLLRFALDYKKKNNDATASDIISEIEKKESSLLPQGSIVTSFLNSSLSGTKLRKVFFSQANQDDVRKALFGESETASAMNGWTFSQNIVIREVNGVQYIQINNGEPIPLESVSE